MSIALTTKSYEGSLEASGKLGPDEIVALVSTDSVDRDSEVVLPQGIDLEDYRKNPVVLAHHDNHSLPVGVAQWIKVSSDGRGIVAKIKFDLSDPTAAMICSKYKNGFMRAFSIGFIPQEMSAPTREEVKGRPEWSQARSLIRKSQLLEFSCVSVPANQDALLLMKSAIPHAPAQEILADDHDMDGAESRIRAWASSDGSGDKDKVDWEKYEKAYFHVDHTEREQFQSYKGLHHDIKDGELCLVKKAVASCCHAMEAGDYSQCSEEEMAGLKSHLRKHAIECGMICSFDRKEDDDSDSGDDDDSDSDMDNSIDAAATVANPDPIEEPKAAEIPAPKAAPFLAPKAAPKPAQPKAVPHLTKAEYAKVIKRLIASPQFERVVAEAVHEALELASGRI